MNANASDSYASDSLVLKASRARAERRAAEHTDNAERWMVSYADFITLLFGFFVVMYAISSVNDEKYRVLSATLSEVFAVDVNSPDPIRTGEPSLAASPHVVDLPDSTAFADQDEGDTFIRTSAQTAEQALAGFADEGGLSVIDSPEWLEISLDASVLFDSGQVALRAEARPLLEQAAALLAEHDHPITVEGYSDNVPVETNNGSNWQVSAARASSVAQFLNEAGLAQERIAAIGYGENHPVATNATPAGRAANRRVVIVVARKQAMARNLNSEGAVIASAVRTTPAEKTLDGVEQSRTEDGGLIFRAPEASDAEES